jgi:hypothetical protein
MSWVITGTQKNNWDPSLISTALWLDAADASTITESGGAVSQWNDKSGGAYNFTQSSSTLRPLYASETLNSKSIITFDGIDDNMSAGDVLDSVWTGSGFNIFFVAKNNNVSSSSGVILTKLSNFPLDLRQVASYLRSGVSQFGAFYTPDVSNYTVVNGSTVINNSQWVVVSQSYDDTLGVDGTTANTTVRVQMTVNGNEQTEVVAGSAGNLGQIQNTAGLLSIGAAIANGTQNVANLDGAIAELIVTPSVLSVSNRQKIEGYLAHKWGLTASLPAGHPYKTAVPVP